MVDAIPYIIVDKKRIYPVESSSDTGPAKETQKKREEPAFGIVDRVTISKEARAKSRLYHAQTAKDALANEGLPDKPDVDPMTLLTHSADPRR